jgi:hypothetical protein
MTPDKAKCSQKSSIILREKGRESLPQFNVGQVLDGEFYIYNEIIKAIGDLTAFDRQPSITQRRPGSCRIL